MTNLSPQPRPQVSLWNRYGHVAFYDDTSVKNRYRMPIGLFAVIDIHFRTRIVGQSITADTTTDTFISMLENALASRGGKQPGIFIQGADAATTGQSDTSSRTRRPDVACGICTRTSSKLSPQNWAVVCMCEPVLFGARTKYDAFCIGLTVTGLCRL